MTAATTIELPYGMTSFTEGRPDERALVIAAQAGTSEAFASLVRLHQRRAYAVCRAIVLTHEDAEDAVQEGFLHAFKALDRFLPDQPFGAWLYRIMANASLDLVRRRKVRDADELPETIALPFRDPGESDELRRRLNQALTKLTDRQRSVIVLHDVEGFTHGEIGEMLGIPEGTARSDLHHARAALRRILKGRSERSMTEFRLISSDDDEADERIAGGLRALYAAPAGYGYWNELESRIMARVADVELGWWTELDRWVRPALAAAAVLLLAAGAAMFRAHQLESDIAIDNMLSPSSVPVSTAIRPALDNDREARIRYLFGCSTQEPSCSAPSNKR